MDLSPLAKAIPSWGSPTLEGFDMNVDAQSGQRIKGSARQYVRFYLKKWAEVIAKKVKVNEKTGSTQVLETEIVNREREFVHVVTPGDKNDYDGPAEDFHKREFWAQYRAFRDGKGIPVGTSIDEVSFISTAIATELKYLGVHTLEQLADGSDLLCGQVADGWMLREYARAVVKAGQNNQNVEQVSLLKTDLQKAQETIMEMAEAQKRMQAQLIDLQGRPIQSEPKQKGKV